MTWVAVTRTDLVEVGHATAIDVRGTRLAICNAGDGFYAIDDLCTHDGGALDQGLLDDHQIECPRHGARFDIVTGKVMALPAVRPVRSYPTRVVDGLVEVDLPE